MVGCELGRGSHTHLKATYLGHPMSHMVFYVVRHGLHNPRVTGYLRLVCAKLDNLAPNPVRSGVGDPV